MTPRSLYQEAGEAARRDRDRVEVGPWQVMWDSSADGWFQAQRTPDPRPEDSNIGVDADTPEELARLMCAVDWGLHAVEKEEELTLLDHEDVKQACILVHHGASEGERVAAWHRVLGHLDAAAARITELEAERNAPAALRRETGT